MGYSRSGADVTRATAAAGSASVAATAAGMSATAAAAMASTAAAAMTSTTAAAAAAAFSCVGRGRQRSGKNKDDNPELESRH
jgi:hypothetical protein